MAAEGAATRSETLKPSGRVRSSAGGKHDGDGLVLRNQTAGPGLKPAASSPLLPAPRGGVLEQLWLVIKAGDRSAFPSSVADKGAALTVCSNLTEVRHDSFKWLKGRAGRKFNEQHNAAIPTKARRLLTET